MGTMTRSGATCPFCETIMTWDDLRHAGQAKAFGAMMIAVVVDEPRGKTYRLPSGEEMAVAGECGREVEHLFAQIPSVCRPRQRQVRRVRRREVHLFATTDSTPGLKSLRPGNSWLWELSSSTRDRSETRSSRRIILLTWLRRSPRTWLRHLIAWLTTPARFVAGIISVRSSGTLLVVSHFRSFGTSPRSIPTHRPQEAIRGPSSGSVCSSPMPFIFPAILRDLRS